MSLGRNRRALTILRLAACVSALGLGAAFSAVTYAPEDGVARAAAPPASPTAATPVRATPDPAREEEPVAEPFAPAEPDLARSLGLSMSNGRVISGATPHRLVLFTFDDGPNRHTTPRLLDLLDAAGVRAVFFLTANRIRGDNRRERIQQDIAREIVRRGHMVGSHTVDHAQLPALDNREVLHQLVEAEHIFERVLGGRPWLFRPPGGGRTDRVDALIAERGYTSVLWNLGTGDFQVSTPEEVAATWRRVLAFRERDSGERGGIILLHDIHEHSVDAFPLIVQELRRRNCRLLEGGEELYDIVDDPRLFFTPRADATPSAVAPPATPEDSVIAARQAALRQETRQRCEAVASL